MGTVHRRTDPLQFPEIYPNRIHSHLAKDPAALVIEDTGIGIDPADIPRLGERGFTGYNGRLDKKSTGIGLYLCKEISRRLSHTLTIESEPGKGTRVTIDFATRQLQAE